VPKHLEGDCTKSPNADELAQVCTDCYQARQDDEKLHILSTTQKLSSAIEGFSTQCTISYPWIQIQTFHTTTSGQEMLQI